MKVPGVVAQPSQLVAWPVVAVIRRCMLRRRCWTGVDAASAVGARKPKKASQKIDWNETATTTIEMIFCILWVFRVESKSILGCVTNKINIVGKVFED